MTDGVVRPGSGRLDVVTIAAAISILLIGFSAQLGPIEWAHLIFNGVPHLALIVLIRWLCPSRSIVAGAALGVLATYAVCAHVQFPPSEGSGFAMVLLLFLTTPGLLLGTMAACLARRYVADWHEIAQSLVAAAAVFFPAFIVAFIL